MSLLKMEGSANEASQSALARSSAQALSVPPGPPSTLTAIISSPIPLQDNAAFRITLRRDEGLDQQELSSQFSCARKCRGAALMTAPTSRPLRHRFPMQPLS